MTDTFTDFIAETISDNNDSEVNAASEKPRKAAPKPARPKPAANGAVYLLLGKNGKYTELSEAELYNHAAAVLSDPALRLVKGHLLVPAISFQAPGQSAAE